MPVLHRKMLYCSVDLTETAHACWIAHFASAHSGLDQLADLLRDRARSSASDLFAGVALCETKAVADGSPVARCFCANSLANLVDCEPYSVLTEIDDRAIWIRTETIMFTIYASEVLVLNVMNYRLKFDRSALNATVDTASGVIYIA